MLGTITNNHQNLHNWITVIDITKLPKGLDSIIQHAIPSRYKQDAENDIHGNKCVSFNLTIGQELSLEIWSNWISIEQMK